LSLPVLRALKKRGYAGLVFSALIRETVRGSLTRSASDRQRQLAPFPDDSLEVIICDPDDRRMTQAPNV
jgi:hypothetical protein